MHRDLAAALRGARGPLTLSLAMSGCASDAPPPSAVVDVSPAPAAAEPKRTLVRPSLALDPARSSVEFLLDAPLERQRAKFTGDAIRGVLHLATDALGQSHGAVSVDLSRMRIERSETREDGVSGEWTENAKQNEHARHWLELDPQGEPARYERNRWATVTVSYFEPREEKRTSLGIEATGKLHGELTLHQRSRPLTLPGKLTISTSSSLEARFEALEPLEVALADFDVAPRDAEFAVLETGLGLLGRKVSKTAKVFVAVTFGE